MVSTNWTSGVHALRVIKEYLQAQDATLLTQARMLDIPAQGTPPTLLPGFTPFCSSNGIATAPWSIPTCRREIDDVIAIYEEYVDRPQLGALRKPCQVARRIIGPAVAQKFFGPVRKPWDWWEPAARIIAIAANLTGLPLLTAPGRMVLDLGEYRMEATRRGCYSNFRGRIVVAKLAAHDADITSLSTRELRTAHPLARALVQGSAPLPVLWAANAAIRAEPTRGNPSLTARQLDLPVRRGRGLGVRNFSKGDIRGAIAACQEILENSEGDMVGDLYASAVPILMSRKEFAEVVANPWGSAERVLGGALRQRLLDRLDVLGKDA